MKICTKCKIEKELSEFHKDKNRKDGCSPSCKDCAKIYRDNNKEQRKIYSAKHYSQNKDIKKQYYENNKEHIRNYNTLYKRNKRKQNIQLRLTDSLRTRIHHLINGKIKSLNTMFLIGCEIDYLMYHLQSQFTKGMSWDNYGDWHIDHIKPCALFTLSKKSEQIKCFNYMNLQPLWAIDNIRKKDKY